MRVIDASFALLRGQTAPAQSPAILPEFGCGLDMDGALRYGTPAGSYTRQANVHGHSHFVGSPHRHSQPIRCCRKAEGVYQGAKSIAPHDPICPSCLPAFRTGLPQVNGSPESPRSLVLLCEAVPKKDAVAEHSPTSGFQVICGSKV